MQQEVPYPLRAQRLPAQDVRRALRALRGAVPRRVALIASAQCDVARNATSNLATKRCGKTFECGHQCRGLCGEPCPRCLECEPVAEDENLYVPDDGTVPFVRVGECGHIFDVETFDGFMKAEAEKSRVQPIECPQCKQPIGLHTMPRYKRQLVIVDRGIQEAKRKMQQVRDNIVQQREAAGKLLNDLQSDRSQLPGFPECVVLFQQRFNATKR
jgi:hypothetical protein